RSGFMVGRSRLATGTHPAMKQEAFRLPPLNPALAHDGGERVRVTVRPPYGPRPGGVDRGGDRVPEYLEIVREGEVVARTVGHELHGGAPPGIRAHDQHRHTRGNRVTLEPLDRLALGASGRDDDGSR